MKYSSENQQKFLDAIKAGELGSVKSMVEQRDALGIELNRAENGDSVFQSIVHYNAGDPGRCDITLSMVKIFGDLASKKQLDDGFFNQSNENGETIFYQFCAWYNKELITYLAENHSSLGLDLNKGDKYGSTALHTTLYNSDAALFLIEHSKEWGIDLNKASKNGVTPLHQACHNGKSDIVKSLVKHGVDVDAKTNNGKTALEIAQAHLDEHMKPNDYVSAARAAELQHDYQSIVDHLTPTDPYAIFDDAI